MKFIFLVLMVMLSPKLFAAENPYGVFMVVRGDLKITEAASQKATPAHVGAKVFQGDSILSGDDSSAKIVMSDRNVIVISANSKITIQQYLSDDAEKKVELQLDVGQIRVNVEKQYDGEKSTFNVITPSGVAGVRGTDFLSSYDPKTEKSEVITFSGTVAVGEKGPGSSILNPVFVKKGESVVHARGQKPGKPRALTNAELQQKNQRSKVKAAHQNSEEPARKKHSRKDRH